jgi:hypothetical protein
MNRQNVVSQSRSATFNVIFVVLLVALIGVPLYLGLWQLAVYPAVIGGLVLFWMYLNYKARTDPNDPLGFIDHVGGMFFSLIFVGPSMLFLAGWTVYLILGGGPILSKSALVIAGLFLSLLILSGPLSELLAGLFKEQRARKRRSRKPRKGSKVARKSRLHWIAPLFRPYLKLETKLTTGVARGDGQETQLSETVFHFRSVVLNVIVIAIRWYLGETSHGVTYLQMVWIHTSLVGWYIYREKSASGVPIIEPGDAMGVMIWGFIGGLFISALTSTIIEALVTTGFNTNNFIKSFEFFGVSTALFFVFFGVGWLEHKLRGESGWITWIVSYGCIFALIGITASGLQLATTLFK